MFRNFFSIATYGLPSTKSNCLIAHYLDTDLKIFKSLFENRFFLTAFVIVAFGRRRLSPRRFFAERDVRSPAASILRTRSSRLGRFIPMVVNDLFTIRRPNGIYSSVQATPVNRTVRGDRIATAQIVSRAAVGK